MVNRCMEMRSRILKSFKGNYKLVLSFYRPILVKQVFYYYFFFFGGGGEIEIEDFYAL